MRILRPIGSVISQVLPDSHHVECFSTLMNAAKCDYEDSTDNGRTAAKFNFRGGQVDYDNWLRCVAQRGNLSLVRDGRGSVRQCFRIGFSGLA